MAKCIKCGKEYVPVRVKQQFCSAACRNAHNNYLKMTGIHLCPRALFYVQGLAEARKISNDEMANEMILRMANPDGQPLTSEEAVGIAGNL